MNKTTDKSLGIAGKLASYFIESKLTPLIIMASLFLGMLTLIALPREEEPQIIVPMIDIFVAMPGASAKEVEVRAAKPMEKLLWEIPGVEYVYTTSSPGYLMAVVRFYVGEDEEKSIIRLQSKLMANYDRIPYGVSPPLIKPRYIDDVPVLCLTFWSNKEDHYTLRRIAAQVEDEIKKLDNVSLTTIIGGYKRQIKIFLDPAKIAAYNLDPIILSNMISSANISSNTGKVPSPEGEILIHLNGFLKSVEDVKNLVVGAYKNHPIYLKDVATIEDGPEEPDNYVFLGLGPAYKGKDSVYSRQGVFPAVTLSIAKRKGSNAIDVVNSVLKTVDSLKGKIIPSDVKVQVTRNYGETAKEKSDELLYHMLLAVISVSLLIWFALGFRESCIVAMAIPVTLALTIAAFYFHGYTLNRITLFALIFSIGILVDDAIVVVENIARHYRLPENQNKSFKEIAVIAVSEVGNPTILASLTVIAAILPMAFVRGLMGPYMRPIPIGATAAMIFSMFVAFIVTPWASLLFLKKERTKKSEKEDFTIRIYRNVMDKLLHKKLYTWLFLMSIIVLLLLSCSLIYFGWVKVKMLPFDNKSEFQVILDMPENATLEDTTKVAMEMGDFIKRVPEVVDYEIYAGVAAPFNFNGMVRHYYLRRGANVSDIQINLINKNKRDAQSHDIAKRIRPYLKKIADKYGADVKVVEVPPGPPVLSTLVAEIYGPDYTKQIEIARKVKNIFKSTPGVVDVDWYMEDRSPKLDIVPDKTKAALHGISTYDINKALEISLKGIRLGLLHLPDELEDVCLFMRMKFSERSKIERLTSIKLRGIDGSLVPLSELVKIERTKRERSIYHKNLRSVVYVVGDVAGEKESPVYAIAAMYDNINNIKLPDGYKIKQLFTSLPKDNSNRYSLKWDGEWQVTYEVFRDLGIAFGIVLVLIFILIVGWFKSFTTPITIMAAIPFSLIGILPAHGILHAFFTATSMIGFIAGAGIVVRNSIILVDFIELRLKEGFPLDKAVIDAGAVRFRPMLLTAAAVVVAASVILLDPIFQGLAISLMFGEVASLLISRMAVPVIYYLDKKWEYRHNKK